MTRRRQCTKDGAECDGWQLWNASGPTSNSSNDATSCALVANGSLFLNPDGIVSAASPNGNHACWYVLVARCWLLGECRLCQSSDWELRLRGMMLGSVISETSLSCPSSPSVMGETALSSRPGGGSVPPTTSMHAQFWALNGLAFASLALAPALPPHASPDGRVEAIPSYVVLPRERGSCWGALGLGLT